VSPVEAVLPAHLRHLSSVHWTPSAVAARAVEWLAPAEAMRVLDVGSGVGKLCLIGAMRTSSHWYGVERERPLVASAIEAAETLGLRERTCFLHGDALAIDWSAFEALYFYNPFDPGTDIAHVEARLAALRPGVRVVTYCGFGGVMPAGYDQMASETIEDGELALWVRLGLRRSRR
jgi:ubiquinone/menaquinone biosynthesis C-methylase UbiE